MARDRPNEEHRAAFFAARPHGPWPCEYGRCRSEVVMRYRSQVVVHHADEDKANNDPANLQAMHNPCHMSHHMSLRRAEREG